MVYISVYDAPLEAKHIYFGGSNPLILFKLELKFLNPFLPIFYNKHNNIWTRIDLMSHFPSIDLMPPPLGVENVKIRENSEKIRGPPGDP